VLPPPPQSLSELFFSFKIASGVFFAVIVFRRFCKVFGASDEVIDRNLTVLPDLPFYKREIVSMLPRLSIHVIDRFVAAIIFALICYLI
jgi:hypothetical protein